MYTEYLTLSGFVALRNEYNQSLINSEKDGKM